jgi:hypothetical protein
MQHVAEQLTIAHVQGCAAGACRHDANMWGERGQEEGISANEYAT